MHIIPFNGREHSGTYDLNLLFNDGKTYIMDNHLAAIWCWLRKIDTSKQYNLLHIDRHYDLLNSQTDWWVEELTKQNIDLQKLSIQEFSNLTYHSEHSPIDMQNKLFRWDNYLTIFNRIYPNLIASNIFATHKDGDTIDELEISEKECWDLQTNLSYWLKNGNEFKWIVNLDIDYFFTDYEEKYYQLFTDEFALKIADEIKNSMENIEVLTIALSPEMCGGWDKSERLAKLITEHLNTQWI